MLWNVQPQTEYPIKPPSTDYYIPFVNIRMEFALNLTTLTFQLGQQILDVVLQEVPATSNYEALLYTEQGSTPQSQFIYITAKFYDGDVSQVNSLLRDAPYLVRQVIPIDLQMMYASPQSLCAIFVPCACSWRQSALQSFAHAKTVHTTGS